MKTQNNEKVKSVIYFSFDLLCNFSVNILIVFCGLTIFTSPIGNVLPLWLELFLLFGIIIATLNTAMKNWGLSWIMRLK